MSFLVSLLPVAGCGLMMWFCMRGMRRGKCSTAETTPPVEVEELRAEVARLRAQLNAQPDALVERSLDR